MTKKRQYSEDDIWNALTGYIPIVDDLTHRVRIVRIVERLIEFFGNNPAYMIDWVYPKNDIDMIIFSLAPVTRFYEASYVEIAIHIKDGAPVIKSSSSFQEMFLFVDYKDEALFENYLTYVVLALKRGLDNIGHIRK